MKISERAMTNPQKLTQMQHYWDALWHLTPDNDKKKNLEKRFGIRNIKIDNRGKILSFEEIEKKVKSFEQFLEAKQKTVVFSFGRLNPPTVGHQKLLQKIVQTAKKMSGQPMMFVSYSQDAKKNPLTAKQKISYIKKMFPKEDRQIEIKEDTGIRNAIDVATALNGYYENLVMVVGSDRVRDFKINGEKT